MKKERKTDRYTAYCGIMYTEDERCNAVIEKIKSEETEGYAIEHDSDGKPHYHVIVKLTNGQTLSAFRKSMGEIGHLFQVLEDWEAMAAYLEHDDEKSEEAGKAKYKLENGYGTLKDKMVAIRKKMKTRLRRVSTAQESATIAELLAYIDGQDKLITVRNIVDIALAGGWYDVLRRNWSIVCALCREHNEMYDRRVTMEEQVAQDVSERLVENWTNFVALKEQFAELNPKLLKEAVEERIHYETSLKLLQENVKAAISTSVVRRT